MRRIFFIVFGFLLAACGGLNGPAPTGPALVSPGPVPALATPTLIGEIDLGTQTGTAYTLDWSPDGQTLAVASGFEITLLSEDLVATQTVLRPEGGGLAVSWSPDQAQLATVNGYRNRTVKIWDLDGTQNELTLAREVRAASDQYAVFWSSDGKLLATLADDDKSTFQIWDTNTWEEIQKFDLPYTIPRRTMSWSADSARLYGAGEKNTQVVIFALNVISGSAEELARFPAAEVEVFAFSPDATKLVVADARGAVQILDSASGKVLTGFKSIDQPVDLAWNPDGSTLAILGYKTTLQLWEVSD